jgi:hypothetical protein
MVLVEAQGIGFLPSFVPDLSGVVHIKKLPFLDGQPLHVI